MRAPRVPPYNEVMAVETPARTRRLLFLRPDAALAEAGDRLLDHPTIVFDGTCIAAVERRPITAPDGASVVDLPGVTLLPGLIDIHMHLIFDASADPIGALAARTDDQALDSMVVAAGQALRAGITTVRDLGDSSYLAAAVTAPCRRAAHADDRRRRPTDNLPWGALPLPGCGRMRHRWRQGERGRARRARHRRDQGDGVRGPHTRRARIPSRPRCSPSRSCGR